LPEAVDVFVRELRQVAVLIEPDGARLGEDGLVEDVERVHSAPPDDAGVHRPIRLDVGVVADRSAPDRVTGGALRTRLVERRWCRLCSEGNGYDGKQSQESGEPGYYEQLPHGVDRLSRY